MRVAFFGSPDFALPVFAALRDAFDVVLVVAQPSKPVGRGGRITPPPVAAQAQEWGVPLLQPEKLRNNTGFAEALKELDLDVAVTCAYGKILPAALLGIPKHGFLNVHTSLLPAYRGAAPIQWAIANGETRTGVTIMQTDPGMDTGPLLLQEALSIGPHETILEVAPRLSDLGARLIVEALHDLPDLQPQAQDNALATHAPMLQKSDGEVNWDAPTAQTYNRYRAFLAWPGSFFFVAGKRVKILEMQPTNPPTSQHSSTPGTVVSLAPFCVATQDGLLGLRRVQPETKAAMNASDWARGQGLKVGDGLL